MREPEEHLILLDTHIWIWLVMGHAQLKSSRSLQQIQHAVKHSNLRLSAISIWEVGMLEAKGRIQFQVSCLDWARQALGAPGILLVPLSPEIAIESSRLPGDFHGDPADRIIVATARHLAATLVTSDKDILAYGKQKHLSVLSA